MKHPEPTKHPSKWDNNNNNNNNNNKAIKGIYQHHKRHSNSLRATLAKYFRLVSGTETRDGNHFDELSSAAVPSSVCRM
jgi:hypothetical protein